MRVSEVAERCGVSVQAVREYCRSHFDESKKGRSGWNLTDDDAREIIAYYSQEGATGDDGKRESGESTRKERKGSSESGTGDQVSELISELRNQLAVKDAQIESLSESLKAAHESLHAAQALHGADVLPKAIEAGAGGGESAEDDEGADASPTPTRWEFFKAAITGRLG